MIEVSNVCKSIDGVKILDSLSLKIKKGSIFGLVGTNGAGKTTLIKCIMGIWSAESGYIKINDIDTRDNPSFREITAYVSDDITVPNSYTVNDAKKLYKLAYKRFDDSYFNKINDIFNIPLGARVRELSKGMSAKLSIMLNLSLNPEYLIMDEPLAGLDPLVRKETIKLLFSDAADRGTTILISSHNLADIERFCDNFAVVDKGKLLFTDSIEEAKEKIRKMQAVFPNGIPEEIHKIKDISNISILGRVAHFVTSNYNKQINDSLTALGASFVESIDVGLDEMFYHVMGGTNND